MAEADMNELAALLHAASKQIAADAHHILGPPEEGLRADHQHVLPTSVVRNTRGYLEKVANQINGCYERAWYDACAVMIRRLIETLIIEVYEHYKIAQNIKGPSGDFFFLRDLITSLLNEPTWNPFHYP